MTFDQYIGVQYAEDETINEATIDLEEHHLNPTGNINGGVFISMADNLATKAAGRAYFEKTGENKFMVGIDLHTVMLSNQEGGQIRALSRAVRVGRRVTVIRTEIVGESDKLLAEVTTTHVPT